MVKRAADLYAQGRTLRQIGAELAKQAHMTVSGAWSRYQKAGRRSPHAWAVGSTAVTTRIPNRGWI
jgi:hypothetical protein